MQRFEEVLDECLEGLRSGRLTLEDCLSRYPRWAEQLAPLLRMAATLGETFADENPDTAADPAFCEEARGRFLMAGAARRLATPKTRDRPDGRPSGRWWAPPLRLRAFLARPVVMGATLAFLVGFVGFSSYTVVTSSDVLPGDWRYPVKRAGEQVRLTFAFDDHTRRGLHISFAEERLSELERLAASQRTIPEPVLRDLTSATDALGENLASVPQQHIERIGELAQKEQETLMAVEPLVEPEAMDDLQAALQTSEEVYDGAVHALALVTTPPGEEPPDAQPEEPSEAALEAMPPTEAAASETAEPAQEGTATPEASATPEQDGDTEPSATPLSEPTPVPAGPTPALEPTPVEPGATPPAPEPTPPVPERLVVFLPDDTTAGITWNLMTIGDFSLTVPADGETDWEVSTLPHSSGERIFVGHRWLNRFDAVIVVEVGTGEASVHILIAGTTRQVPADEVRSLVPAPTADVIFHVLESADLGA